MRHIRTGAARRWWNIRTPERYIGAVGSGRSPQAGTEEIWTDRVRELESLHSRDPAPPPVFRTARSPTTRSSTGWWSVAGTVRCSLSGVGCSRTRWQ